MNEAKAWLSANIEAAILISLVCILLGILLLIISWLLRLRIKGIVNSATNGGVAIGRDNFGTVITGGIDTEKIPKKISFLAMVANWVTIIGLPLAILGVVIGILAWQFPV